MELSFFLNTSLAYREEGTHRESEGNRVRKRGIGKGERERKRIYTKNFRKRNSSISHQPPRIRDLVVALGNLCKIRVTHC